MLTSSNHHKIDTTSDNANLNYILTESDIVYGSDTYVSSPSFEIFIEIHLRLLYLINYYRLLNVLRFLSQMEVTQW